jgi:hypothetical protein
MAESDWNWIRPSSFLRIVTHPKERIPHLSSLNFHLSSWFDPPGRISDPSGASRKTHGDFLAFHNYRHLALAVGYVKHFIQFFRALLHIEIVVGFECLTGFIGVGSARLAVNNDPVGHDDLLSFG